MANLNLTFQLASFPEGFQGTPKQFAEAIVENITAIATSNFIGGQIGGARPLTDVGLFITADGGIEIWDTTLEKYRPAEGVPVGTILPWARSPSDTPPINYLICKGALLLRADYPDLFAVIGTTWGSTSADNFKLPDASGRVALYAGTGEFNPLVEDSGALRNYPAGSYYGKDWPRNEATPANAPTGRYRFLESNEHTDEQDEEDQPDRGGIHQQDGSLVGSVVQPAVVCVPIIRYR